MDPWLAAALDYIPRWIGYQMRALEQPGCILAIAHRGEIALEQAFGCADLSAGTKLDPRHRFRIASHSKSFTAAGIMKLREMGRLHLDDRIGDYVTGLHPEIGAASISQLLSHTAGIVRDGTDAGYFSGRLPFPDAAKLRDDLAAAPAIEANTRLKYSNHGYGLVGLLIETVTGECYVDWIRREIVQAAGLTETEPDITDTSAAQLAAGHSGKLPLGRRMVIADTMRLNALAPAGGFVSTAADLARFFSQLSPGSERSPITAASRREMIRRQWRDPHTTFPVWYGLGIMSGETDGWEWFGHSGGLEGYNSRTSVIGDRDLAISVLTNATDGFAGIWVEGIIHILARFAKDGPPTDDVADWTGRWWSSWGAVDLVPAGRRVLVAVPGMFRPLQCVSEVEVTEPDHGRIALAGGFGSHAEPVRRERDAGGAVREVWLASSRLVPEEIVAGEMRERCRPADAT